MKLDHLEDEITYALGVAADWADESLAPGPRGKSRCSRCTSWPLQPGAVRVD